MNARKVAIVRATHPESVAFYAALGKRIEQLRKSRGYTQAEVAALIGTSQQGVFDFGIGTRRVSVDPNEDREGVRRVLGCAGRARAGAASGET